MPTNNITRVQHGEGAMLIYTGLCAVVSFHFVFVLVPLSCLCAALFLLLHECPYEWNQMRVKNGILQEVFPHGAVLSQSLMRSHQ